MPTIGPSLLFAAGLTLGVGAGVFYPRRPKAADIFIPPSPLGNERRDAVTPVKMTAGSSILHGGFPGGSR